MYTTASTILVAIPPTLHRQGVLSVLQTAWPACTYTLLTEANPIPALLRRQSFALVLLDADLLPSPFVSFLRNLRTIRSPQPLLLLTGRRVSTELRGYLAQPGQTCLGLPRRVTPVALMAAVRPFLSEAPLAAAVSTPPSRRAPGIAPGFFSRRELDVLRLVMADCRNHEIAAQLCLSVRTVESHRRALLQKAGTRTLVGLVVQAVREGWVVTA